MCLQHDQDMMEPAKRKKVIAAAIRKCNATLDMHATSSFPYEAQYEQCEVYWPTAAGTVQHLQFPSQTCWHNCKSLILFNLMTYSAPHAAAGCHAAVPGWLAAAADRLLLLVCCLHTPWPEAHPCLDRG